jgi:murein DD-endopeptidase MepM/ murein hydrolase activator NlpD
MNDHKPRSSFRFDPAWLTALGLIGFAGYLHESLAPLRLFLFFFIVPTVRLFWPKPKTADASQPETPLPGPAQRLGPSRFMLNLFASQLLTLFNPLQFAQQLWQAGGQGLALLRVRGQTPTAETYRPQARYTLPFEGEWYVFNGGVTEAASHSWDIVAQRYAYDFVITDAARQRHSGQGDQVTDYFCYGQPIRAVADGEVVAARDGVRDAPQVGNGWIDWLSPDFRGNSVTIRHAEAEYSFSAHLIPGSLTVKVGERVRRGQIIGRCGHSGHSTEPHLHFQLQDHPNFWLAVGLPVMFDDVVVDGVAADRMHLRCGAQVKAA